MESYIQITQLNDFFFCPRSIYWANLYRQYESAIYDEKNQVEGKLAHETIDNRTYSTAKKWLQGSEIYSEEYRICGKIDLFNTDTGQLVERKNKIEKIYQGYLYQIWAQYICLKEMGYHVKSICLHSLKDNTRYPLDIPTTENIAEITSIIHKFHTFRLEDPFEPNKHKCDRCIYRHLCDLSLSKQT